MKLVLLCVETRDKANTDLYYIDKTIKQYYKMDNSILVRYIKLTSKTMYANTGIQNRIQKECAYVGKNNASIIYCIDTDDYDLRDEDRILNQKIEAFCMQNGYSFVWFCKNIEQVFLHKDISKHQKADAAKQFGAKNSLENIKESNLRAKNFSNQTSNILTVLDKVLPRKQKIVCQKNDTRIVT